MEHPKKSTLVRAYPFYYNQFDVSFDVKPLAGVIYSWGSIFRCALGDSTGKYGDRVPGVWFYPGTRRLHICNAVSGNKNYCFNEPRNLDLHHFTNIRITQSKSSLTGHFLYRVYVQGKLRKAAYNTLPMTFYNVKCFLGDHLNSPAKALVKNLKIKLSSSGTYNQIYKIQVYKKYQSVLNECR